MEGIKKLAEEHWDYVSKVLKTHGEDEKTIAKIGFHYKTAFVHGAKHEREDKK